MAKVNSAIINILVLSFLVCLNPSGFAVDPCPDCPQNLPTIPGIVDCNPNWTIVWNPDNPQQVIRNGSVTLQFKGGTRPYDLAVSGTDFWFDDNHRITSIAGNDTGTITVYAGSNACGSATLTINDGCNVQSTGYVRSNSGTWIRKTQYDGDCQMPGSYTSLVPDHDYGWNAEYVSGRSKQTVYIYEASSSWASEGTCDNPTSGYTSCWEKWRGCKDRGWRCLEYPTGCEDCLSTGIVPCQEGPNGYKCWCQRGLTYYEWECQ